MTTLPADRQAPTRSTRPDPLVAPPGLKNLIVADTEVGGVQGQEGFFHYRQYDATEVARAMGFEAMVHLLLHGRLPGPGDEAAIRRALGRGRGLTSAEKALVDHLADAGHGSMDILRTVLSLYLDPAPTLDLSPSAIRDQAIRAVGLAPSILARGHRLQTGLEPLDADPSLGHVEDYVRMLGGQGSDGRLTRAVERYMCLTADHGFNASTFTARVITSTGASVGGALCGAMAALSGPLHGGAPARVLDMLERIGEPARAYGWATAELEAGRFIMGFGHAVYRSGDPRSALLKETPIADRGS